MSDEPTMLLEVIIIDDHRMFAESLARLLADEPDISVVGVASSGAEGLRLAAELCPAVALVDFRMPDLDGLAITAELKRLDPSMMVVMLSASASDSVLLAAIDAGCSGFVTKDRAASAIIEAVRAAAAGDAVISPALLARLLPQLNRSSGIVVGRDLTERDREILVRLARGASNKVIADDLYLSVNTVRNYVQSVLHKLGAHSKLEAVATAVREGMIDYPASRG